MFGSQMAGCRTGEITLAKAVLPSLQPDMLCLADRQFFGFALWNTARGTAADLLIKRNMRLACEERLPDGSYLSCTYASRRDGRRKTDGVTVRVTSILDHRAAPAEELAAL
ncbi:MAG: IS4 family transposase, partial [Vicinamibacterales bacterium]